MGAGEWGIKVRDRRESNRSRNGVSMRSRWDMRVYMRCVGMWNSVVVMVVGMCRMRRVHVRGARLQR